MMANMQGTQNMAFNAISVACHVFPLSTEAGSPRRQKYLKTSRHHKRGDLMEYESEPRLAEQPAEDARYGTFFHLAAPRVELYRSILRAFSRAKEHFEISLRPTEVSRWLTSDRKQLLEEDLISALDQLRQWGNLDANQD